MPSTHAAVIYLAAKHTPGSSRMVEEVIDPREMAKTNQKDTLDLVLARRAQPMALSLQLMDKSTLLASMGPVLMDAV